MSKVGRYYFGSAVNTVQASAQNGTSTGFYWMHVPVAGTKRVILRALSVAFAPGSALATPTAPMITFSKATFTGTASGASETPVPEDTGNAAAAFSIRSAVTGLTPTLVGPLGQALVPGAETAVGAFYANIAVIPFDPNSGPRFSPGEGIAVWQSVAGTTSDTRKFAINAIWDELTL